MSVALQIRDVPEEVRDALAAQAAQSGESLQRFLLRLVTREAVHQRNLAILDGLHFAAGGLTSAESVVEVLDRSRAERDDELSGRMG
jgi:hypothetical protein